MRPKHLEGSKKFGMIALEWLPLLTSATEIKVFTVLCAHADKTTTEARPSKPTIARITGIDPRDVQRALRRLEELAAIKPAGIGQWGETIYEVRPAPKLADALVLKSLVAKMRVYLAAGLSFRVVVDWKKPPEQALLLLTGGPLGVVKTEALKEINTAMKEFGWPSLVGAIRAATLAADRQRKAASRLRIVS